MPPASGSSSGSGTTLAAAAGKARGGGRRAAAAAAPDPSQPTLHQLFARAGKPATSSSSTATPAPAAEPNGSSAPAPAASSGSPPVVGPSDVDAADIRSDQRHVPVAGCEVRCSLEGTPWTYEREVFTVGVPRPPPPPAAAVNERASGRRDQHMARGGGVEAATCASNSGGGGGGAISGGGGQQLQKLRAGGAAVVVDVKAGADPCARLEGILAAPYPQQVLLSCCFAAALYCHLSYFFFSMEMLWLAGFALAAGVRLPRWQPLFDSPQRSTSPVDFWNNRWHQAFRWWWTRLLYVPVRTALRQGLDGLQRRYGAGCSGGGGGGAGGGAGGGEAGGVGGGGGGGSGGQEAQQQQDEEEEGGGGAAGWEAALGGRRGGSSSGSSSSGSSGSSRRGLGARLARWLLARRRGLLAAVPTVAVFGFSAAFHESLLWINLAGPQRAVEAAAASPRGPAPLRLLRSAHARLPRPLRAAACLALLASTSPLFFRPWFAASYHRELRVLAYGPTQWAVRVWVLGRPAESVRLFW
ncbi:hypothetical protein HXX76_016290 [Chlamydomonas incerta]|uniref:Wax synthase domain-containing protein n=1 Tax=Chlamydomonas incerta TaxID=51695 RepID=A0A835VQG3_CHLIN|nr:hypothetical protein HXX76_016290 [Chlamydomonas incerta]|eukprot:KAG2422083.1 hypothetical protein HXX76_016290 [Chlamydomonas incerta]